jgi:hypothetical protein
MTRPPKNHRRITNPSPTPTLETNPNKKSSNKTSNNNPIINNRTRKLRRRSRSRKEGIEDAIRRTSNSKRKYKKCKRKYIRN